MSNTAEKTTIVSLFHSREHASDAMKDLQAAGIPTNAIQSLEGEPGSTTVPEQSLSGLKTLNLPQKDLQILSDGLRKGGSLLIVQAEYAIAERAESILEKHSASQIDEQAVQAQPLGAAAAAANGSTVIPVVEEELVVGKRRVDRGGVRVISRIVETPVEEQVVLTEEHATVVRHAVNRPVSAAEADGFQERSIEVQEMGEEAVVGKTSRVVEEISVGKDVSERTQQVKDSVRKTEVEVEQLPGEDVSKTGRRS